MSTATSTQMWRCTSMQCKVLGPRNNFPASGPGRVIKYKIIQVALKIINNQDKNKRGENWQKHCLKMKKSKVIVNWWKVATNFNK